MQNFLGGFWILYCNLESQILLRSIIFSLRTAMCNSHQILQTAISSSHADRSFIHTWRPGSVRLCKVFPFFSFLQVSELSWSVWRCLSLRWSSQCRPVPGKGYTKKNTDLLESSYHSQKNVSFPCVWTRVTLESPHSERQSRCSSRWNRICYFCKLDRWL